MCAWSKHARALYNKRGHMSVAFHYRIKYTHSFHFMWNTNAYVCLRVSSGNEQFSLLKTAGLSSDGKEIYLH